MIILDDQKFIKTNFDNEDELEQVIINNFEYLFGPNSIYLPKKLIKTQEGFGTIPDGFVIDLAMKKWYIVEAELLIHNVWHHIAPQISKQIIAAQNILSKKIIIELTISQYQIDNTIKDKFFELGIKEINIRKVLDEILDSPPIIGLPIDSISLDLKEWARTLKNKVKLWQINKFTELTNSEVILYEFPEEFKPDLDTEVDFLSDKDLKEITVYDISLLDLINDKLINIGDSLIMSYKPRDGQRQNYTAIIDEGGNLELFGKKFSSPSYAALAGIQNSGSNRKTVNGWTSWKTKNGRYLSELRDKLLSKNN